jgi:inner membrane protein
MASILSHPAVPLALAAAAGPRMASPALVAAACVASVLPDIDALGFFAGIPYGDPLGHRGFTHSLCCAFLLGLAGIALSAKLGARPGIAFAMIFASAASHGILDAMTTGGLGVAFFSPWNNARYFLPWRVIVVSPIGFGDFFGSRGLRILGSELLWVWAPCGVAAFLARVLRRAIGGA